MSFLPEGFKPEKFQDNNNDFKPVTGKYIAVIKDILRDVEPWKSGDPKDQIKITFRITKVIEGDLAVNRLIFLQWNMLDSEFNGKVITGAETRSRLISALCTAGYDVDYSSEEAFYRDVFNAVGTECNLSCWVQNDKQRAKIVEKFNIGSKVGKKEDKEELPF